MGTPSLMLPVHHWKCFSVEVKSWLQNKWTANCRKRFEQSLPDDQFIHWDNYTSVDKMISVL